MKVYQTQYWINPDSQEMEVGNIYTSQYEAAKEINNRLNTEPIYEGYIEEYEICEKVDYKEVHSRRPWFPFRSYTTNPMVSSYNPDFIK